jgi:cyanophycinase
MRITSAMVPVVLAITACSVSPAPDPAPQASPETRGHLLIVGGGRQPASLVAHFVELAGGPGRARIAVIPMASGSPESSGQGKVEELVEYGAEAFSLNLDRAQAESDSATRLLDDVTGVWFTGGDQIRLTPILSNTPVLDAIRSRYREGAVIGGTSAGAAIMSDSMLTGEQILEGEDTIGYHGDQYSRVARNAIRIVPGLGFLDNAIVDQHFLERERHNRLLSVILERPALIGVGIGESTAVQVGPDGLWTVMGAGSVLIFDARGATITPTDHPLLGSVNVLTHLLPVGSTYDPARGTAALPTAEGRD